MDAERGFQLLLLAISGILTVLLFLPYTTEILGAIILAYLMSGAHDQLAPLLGPRVAAMGLMAATIVVVLVPFVLVVNVVLEGVNDLLADPIIGGTTYLEIEAILESVFAADIQDPAAVLDLLRRGDVINLLDGALTAVNSFSEAAVHLTVLLFVWYYLLKDSDRFLSWLGTVAPLSTSTQSDLVERADELMYLVVIGNIIVAIADGILVGLGLFIVGFSNVLFWTFVAVFFALIPLVGTMVIWVPAAIYLVLVGDVVAGIGLFAYGLIIVGAVDNVLRPFLGAPEVGLEPGLFVVGVLAGLTMFGVTGLVFGPVLLVMTKVIVETVGQDLKAPE